MRSWYSASILRLCSSPWSRLADIKMGGTMPDCAIFSTARAITAFTMAAPTAVDRDRVAAGNRMDQKYIARPHGLVVHDDPAIIRHALQLAGHGGWIDVQAQPRRAHRIDHGQAACAVIQLQRQKARVAAAEGKDTVSALYRLGKPVRGLLHGFRLRALHFIQHFAHRAKIPTNRVHRKSLLSVASPVHGSAHH